MYEMLLFHIYSNSFECHIFLFGDIVVSNVHQAVTSSTILVERAYALVAHS